jgi:hypothetical protein
MKRYLLASITIAVVLATAFSLPAFGQNEEHVKFAADIEFIKGHLAQALENKQGGNATLAKAHATHPIAEDYSLVKEEIAEHDEQLETQLEDSLTQLLAQVDSLATPDFQNKINEINGMLDRALEAVLSETEREDGKFNALVILLLLETGEHEYEAAIEDGSIVEMVEYQDASAFIARAEVTYQNIRSQVPEHEAEEIDLFFEQGNQIIALKGDVTELETVVGGIIHELEEVFELAERVQVDGWAVIDNIHLLLNQTLAAYQAGDYDEARRLAVVAYLENYELIEPDIEEDNRELMLKIEVALREDLRNMINQTRPVSEVEAHIETIRADLEQARSVVVPEFPIAAGTALATIGATILAGTLYARKAGFGASRSS